MTVHQTAPDAGHKASRTHRVTPCQFEERIADPRVAIQCIKEGLQITAFEGLALKLGVPETTLADTLHIKRRTLARRKILGRLDPLESERVYRIERLVALATAMLRDDEKARRWLKTPKRALGGQSPLAYAETEIGAREVENLVEQIRQGVYT